jgi:hypothetical protein
MTDLRIVVLIALLFSVGEVAGQPPNTDTSANSVLSGCKAFADGRPPTSIELAMLGNYCAGMVHALAGMAHILPPNYQACAPDTSTARQLALVVLRYIEARPRRMHEDFRLLAVEAFHDAWPCAPSR